MSIATALLSADKPSPSMARLAVDQALEKAGLDIARSILLFMTPEFSLIVQPALAAAAGRASCLEIVGGLSAGVFTESGWQLDRPSVAVMVFGGEHALVVPTQPDEPVLSYSDHVLPPAWRRDMTRYGGIFSDGFIRSEKYAQAFWQHARPVDGSLPLQTQISGAYTRVGLSRGMQMLGEPQRIEKARGFDLFQVGGRTALDSLRAALPAHLQNNVQARLPYLACLMSPSARPEGEKPFRGSDQLVGIISADASGTLILEREPRVGSFMAWTMRSPEAAQHDMNQMLRGLSEEVSHPLGALVFSGIGRGPLFYAGEDLDLLAVKQTFPDLPILGVYGTGQLFPVGSTLSPANRIMRNAVVTALFGNHQPQSEAA